MSRYTHYVRYQQADGTWRDGAFAYTLNEAKGVAKAGRARTGRAVKVAKLPPA